MAVIALAVGCSDDGVSADRAICEAILSVGTDATPEEVANAVRAIEDAGSPEREALVDVQTHVESVDGNQLALGARFDDLQASCEAEGVSLDLRTEEP